MTKIKHPWYKSRGYVHFDRPVSLKIAEAIVTDPAKVKDHPFYPFISYLIKSKKIYKDPDGKIGIKTKSRPVSYASHVDSHIYSYYAHSISERYEEYLCKTGIDQNVIAFRKLHKSNIHFANQAFDEIIKRKDCTAIASDIEGFFNNLDHNILKKTLCKVIGSPKLPEDYYNIYKSLTRYATVDKFHLYTELNISKNSTSLKYKRICEPNDFREIVRKKGFIVTNPDPKGIPQGSPISALLSNIYMIDFDRNINSFVTDIGGVYLRYCDDILCIVPTASRNLAIELLTSNIKALELTINDEKTKISDFKFVHGKIKSDKPLQYLGFTFDGERKLIRSAALARYSQRMKSGVNLAKLTKLKHDKINLEKGAATTKLYKNKLYERYSHLGGRNFVTYGLRSADIMESKAMRKQLKPLWQRLHDEIEK